MRILIYNIARRSYIWENPKSNSENQDDGSLGAMLREYEAANSK